MKGFDGIDIVFSVVEVERNDKALSFLLTGSIFGQTSALHGRIRAALSFGIVTGMDPLVRLSAMIALVPFMKSIDLG